MTMISFSGQDLNRLRAGQPITGSFGINLYPEQTAVLNKRFNALIDCANEGVDASGHTFTQTVMAHTGEGKTVFARAALSAWQGRGGFSSKVNWGESIASDVPLEYLALRGLQLEDGREGFFAALAFLQDEWQEREAKEGIAPPALAYSRPLINWLLTYIGLGVFDEPFLERIFLAWLTGGDNAWIEQMILSKTGKVSGVATIEPPCLPLTSAERFDVFFDLCELLTEVGCAPLVVIDGVDTSLAHCGKRIKTLHRFIEKAQNRCSLIINTTPHLYRRLASQSLELTDVLFGAHYKASTLRVAWDLVKYRCPVEAERLMLSIFHSHPNSHLWTDPAIDLINQMEEARRKRAVVTLDLEEHASADQVNEELELYDLEPVSLREKIRDLILFLDRLD